MADVLEPPLLWVQGRCYRFCDSHAWSHDPTASKEGYVEDEFYAVEDYEEDKAMESKIEIVPYNTNKFKHSFHVPRVFFPHIIGSKRATLKRVEMETKTYVQVPRPGQEGDIVIIGNNHSGIISARNRIDLLVASSRKKLSFTHFVSIPLNTDEIVKNFLAFKNDILNSSENVRGIDDAVFQVTHKLHVTIAMLTLVDDNERKEACEILQDCKDRIITPIIEKYGPIKMTVRGLDIMNDDPAEVRVVYGRLEQENNALQEIADRVMDLFVEKGLSYRERDQVKLHMTLMNTHFQETDQNSKRGTFDATRIMEEYGDWFFGVADFNTLHISQMKTATDGQYYKATAKIDF